MNVTVANTPSVPVPTLDARALALLVLGMLALGAFMAHRRS
ncbi:MAG: IPTL-CTERM sorting domain-containing protein [Rhodanobacteraceae bacterium]|nr:IPTL-CTERM sorting domain-containing protein [Rhodanobacteraceae bacterium]